MKKTTLGLGVLALGLGIVGVSAGAVYAYQGDAMVRGPQYSQERHEAMERAFETNNYDAWKNLMEGRGRISQVVTKDNFSRVAEAHELMEQGKKDEARQIMQELGMGSHAGCGEGKGGMMRNGMGR